MNSDQLAAGESDMGSSGGGNEMTIGDFLASVPKSIDQGGYMLHIVKLQDGVLISLDF